MNWILDVKGRLINLFFIKTIRCTNALSGEFIVVAKSSQDEYILYVSSSEKERNDYFNDLFQRIR